MSEGILIDFLWTEPFTVRVPFRSENVILSFAKNESNRCRDHFCRPVYPAYNSVGTLKALSNIQIYFLIQFI